MKKLIVSIASLLTFASFASPALAANSFTWNGTVGTLHVDANACPGDLEAEFMIAEGLPPVGMFLSDGSVNTDDYSWDLYLDAGFYAEETTVPFDAAVNEGWANSSPIAYGSYDAYIMCYNPVTNYTDVYNPVYSTSFTYSAP